MKSIFFCFLSLIIICFVLNTNCVAQSIKDLDIYDIKLGDSAAGLKEKLLAKNPSLVFKEFTLKKSLLIDGSIDSQFPKNDDSLKALIVTSSRLIISRDIDMLIIAYNSDDTILFINSSKIYTGYKAPSFQSIFSKLNSKYGKETTYRNRTINGTKFHYILWNFDNSGNQDDNSQISTIDDSCLGKFTPVPLYNDYKIPLSTNFGSHCNYLLISILSYVPDNIASPTGDIKSFEITMVDLVTLKNEIERYREDKQKNSDNE